MDCRVALEAAIPVYDVGTADEAVRIAISKTGGMLNPDLNYVEIEAGSRTARSGEELEPAFVVAGEALVALELEMTVFNVEGEEHATRIARKEIGGRLEDIPLDVLSVEVLDADDDGDGDDGDGDDGDGDDGDERDERDESNETDDTAEADEATRADGGVLPEFDDLLEE